MITATDTAIAHLVLPCGFAEGSETVIIKISAPTQSERIRGTQRLFPHDCEKTFASAQSAVTTPDATGKEVIDCGVMKTPVADPAGAGAGAAGATGGAEAGAAPATRGAGADAVGVAGGCTAVVTTNKSLMFMISSVEKSARCCDST